MKKKMGMLIILPTFLFSLSSAAGGTGLSMEWESASLADAISFTAKYIHKNVIISPLVQGVVTLRFYQAEPKPAFDLLLNSNDLGEWSMGNVNYIAPKAELIKRKQQILTWQQTSEASSALVTEIKPLRYAKASEAAKILQDGHASFLSKRGHIKVDTRTNTLIVQDVPEKMTEIRRVIKHLDIPVKQILIEARLASVDSDSERQLGLDFDLKSTEPASGKYSLALAKLADGSILDVKLIALEKAGHAELISSPRLFTANQQTASIEAGEEVPYQEVSEGGGTAVAFKKAVLSLKVTPQILPGDKVMLQLNVNQDKPSSRIVLGVPTINTRQIMTSVLLHNGQTVVLGGIYELDRERGQERIPFISSLPLIGYLFQQEGFREKKRELLIFVTPKIIGE